MRLRVAAYVVVVESGRVLLPHWPDEVAGGWTLPGGGIEPGEDPAHAAVREVLGLRLAGRPVAGAGDLASDPPYAVSRPGPIDR